MLFCQLPFVGNSAATLPEGIGCNVTTLNILHVSEQKQQDNWISIVLCQGRTCCGLFLCKFLQQGERKTEHQTTIERRARKTYDVQYFWLEQGAVSKERSEGTLA